MVEILIQASLFGLGAIFGVWLCHTTHDEPTSGDPQ